VVHLPIALESPQSQNSVVEEEQNVKSALCILVLDDNRDSANSLAMLLRVLGNPVRKAYDGQEGVDAAKDYQHKLATLATLAAVSTTPIASTSCLKY